MVRVISASITNPFSPVGSSTLHGHVHAIATLIKGEGMNNK